MSTDQPPDTTRKAGANLRQDTAKQIREWITLLLAIVGCVLGARGYLEARRTASLQTIMQAEELLDEAWDLLGGQPGTSHVVSFTRSYTNLELASRKIDGAALIAPSLPKVHTTRGAYYMARNRWADAVAAYRRAIELDPKNAVSHNNIGSIHVAQGKLEEALTWFQEASRLDPRDPEAVSNSCYVLWKLGRIPEAIADGRRALRIAPDFLQAYDNLAVALIAAGDSAEARALLLRRAVLEREERGVADGPSSGPSNPQRSPSVWNRRNPAVVDSGG